MKKRLLSLVLVLCAILTSVPVIGVAAEEILPKDETPGAQSQTLPEGAHSFTVYDALYIGADGAKTANGGSLIGLYTAYGDDTTVDIAGGKWKNKMDATGTTDAVLRDTSDTISFVKEANGFGYHMNKDQVTANNEKLGLTLPDAWASLDQFTVEHAARIDAVQSPAPLAEEIPAIRLDVFLGMWIPGTREGDRFMTGSDTYLMRWQMGNKITNYGMVNAAFAEGETAYRDAYGIGKKEAGVVASYTKTVDANGAISYGLSYNTGVTCVPAATFTAAEIQAIRDTGAGSSIPAFSLFNGMSGSFYAVRVYDAPLTAAEKAHNAVIDVLACAGVDVADYAALDPVMRVKVDNVFATYTLSDDKAAVETLLNTMVDVFGKAVDVANTMYVQNGLTFFAAAFNGLSTAAYENAGNLNWTNALNPSQVANLRGGFAVNEKGGITVVKDVADIRGNNTNPTSQEFAALWTKQYGMGIYMPASALPREDYTVEVTYNPVGISERKADGTLERYVDTLSSSGNVVHPRAIAIGPFRASLHSCMRASQSGSLEKRWYYSADKSLDQLGWAANYHDFSWSRLDINDVVTYTVTHDYANSASVYKLYNNASRLTVIDVTADKYVTPEAAGDRFQLFLGMAGTAYSIRVYDRALTEEEVAQNKVADMFYYYGLDTSRVTLLASQMGDSSGILYEALSDIPLTLTSAEAQERVDKALSGAWLDFEGVGVRKSANEDGVRYYFTYKPVSTVTMASSGFKIEIGALVNVGKNTAPVLTEDGYDYRFNVYDGDAGRATPFFVDEDTFAVTVRYDNVDKQSGLTQVLVRGYVKVTAADGTETVYYVDPEVSGDDNVDCLFNVYEMVKDNEGVRADAATQMRMNGVIEKCYTRTPIYVSASAAAGGDGSKDKPFSGFANAFAKVKSLLATTAVPTRYVVVLADGEYGVYEALELTATDMPYKYSSLEITSEGGKSTLTTTKGLTEDFTKYADNVWVCQLDKENGEYPCFRTLYVDGELADVAYSTDRYSTDDNIYLSKYDQEYDGPWGRAYDLYKSNMLKADSESGYEREDLDAAFEAYKVKFLALMDMERQFKKGTLTADSVPVEKLPTEKESADVYLACFEEYKLTRLALAEMKEWHDDHPGTDAQKVSAFSSITPTHFPDHAGYVATFNAVKAQIKADNRVGAWSSYMPMVETDSIEKARYYIHEDVVGDLRVEMEAGRKRQQAAFDALQKKYNAASAEEKAELEDDLALAAEKIADGSWYRYALEGYGPELRLNGQWWANIIHVAGVDYEDTVVDSNGDTHIAIYLELEEYVNYQLRAGYTNANRYVCMQDALCYVDSEGEYYYDELSGKLYYYSEDGTAGKSFARGTSDYMFILRGVKNVSFTGLIFTGMDDDYLSHGDGCTSYPGSGADGRVKSANEAENHAYDRSVILLDSCYGLDVYGCRFYDLPVRAIFGKGVLENITVDSCSFERLGSNAIHLGDATAERKWVTGKNHIEDLIITNNYMHDIGLVYFPSAAIWVHYGRNVELTYNTIDTVSWSGIALGFTYSVVSTEPGETFCNIYNADISYNFVRGYMQNIGDGGGIYVTGGNAPNDNTEYFNFMHHNYVLFDNGTGDGLGNMVTGLYFDGSASNWKCYENVVVEQSYGAVAGEDYGFDMEDEDTEKYLQALRKRYRGSYFIYMQHITGQITHNNLLDNNYILNVRATNPQQQHLEVYGTYIVADRNIIERNTHYVTDVNRIPAGAEDIIYSAGCVDHTGDPVILYDNNY